MADLETGARGNYLGSTLAAVETTLGWAPGTCCRVVEGGRVRREADPMMVRLVDAWQLLSPDARAMLVQMAELGVQQGR